MPKAERAQKESMKLLAKAGITAGQRRLDSFYKARASSEANVNSTSGDNSANATSSDNCAGDTVNSIVSNHESNFEGVLHDCSSQSDDKKMHTSSDDQGEDTGAPNDATQFSSCGNDWVKTKDDFTASDKLASERKGRTCCAEWFEMFSWVIYHRKIRAIFCDTCSTFSKVKGTFVYSSSGKGFCNWKKGTQKLGEHEKSEAHIHACVEKVKRGKVSKNDIDFQLGSKYAENQRLRRQGLIAHLNTLKTLLRQGVAIRGANDEESNIVQFNKDKAKHEPGLQLLLKEGTYMSHAVLQEQEKLLVLEARRRLLAEIREKLYYSIIADESCDITKTEQLSISIRTCSDDYVIKEEFIGITDCSKGLSSDALLQYTNDILTRCNLNKKGIIGVTFDGAASMKLLAKKLKQCVGEQVIYVHCFAHCNDLVSKDVTKLSPVISASLELCEELYAIVGAYPKRVQLFEEIQKQTNFQDNENEYKILRLQNLSMTRWTTRSCAANVILSKTQELQGVLNTMSSDTTIKREIRSKAHGLASKLVCLKTMLQLSATYEIFGLLENLSKDLQRADLTAELALFCIAKVKDRLTQFRSDEEFERIFEKASKMPGIEENSTSIVGSRKRKLPAKYDGSYLVEELHCCEDESISDDKTKYRVQYYEAIDAVLSCFEERFCQEDIVQLKAIEDIVINSANNKPPDNVILPSSYEETINFSMLQEDLQSLATIVRLYNANNVVPVKVTRLSTICEIFNAMPAAKHTSVELDKLLKLYLTIALSSATAERSFSTMRRIKTWIRAATDINHLNNTMFSNIHNQRMDAIDIGKVAEEFCFTNDARRNYFGNFNN